MYLTYINENFVVTNTHYVVFILAVSPVDWRGGEGGAGIASRDLIRKI